MGTSAPADSDDGGNGEPIARRSVLAAVGAAAVMPSVSPVTGNRANRTANPTGERAILRVRVYPTPLPPHVTARYGLNGGTGGWPPPHRAAWEAVSDAMAQLAAYATEHSVFEHVSSTVDAMDPIDVSNGAVRSPLDVVSPTRQGVLDAFRSTLHERNDRTELACHLLLWWGPGHFRVGYGGTRRGTSHVGQRPEEGSYAVANVGATERWDSRSVTRNIAIHEALHTFLEPTVVEPIVGTRCDHDLGSAVRVDERTLRVSPMGTAYAGPNEVGGGTRFHGTGCFHHDSFYHHDGYEDVGRFEYTTDLSEGTLEAGTRYLERHFRN